MKIKTYRNKLSLSQQELAEILGCSQGWVSRVELGGLKPSAAMAVYMEKKTGGLIARWEYRPDLWPRPKKEATP